MFPTKHAAVRLNNSQKEEILQMYIHQSFTAPGELNKQSVMVILLDILGWNIVQKTANPHAYKLVKQEK